MVKFRKKQLMGILPYVQQYLAVNWSVVRVLIEAGGIVPEQHKKNSGKPLLVGKRVLSDILGFEDFLEYQLMPHDFSASRFVTFVVRI